MRLKNYNGVEYYVFDSFEKSGLVSHMFSTRIGGVSEGEFSSLNLSFGRGDDPEKVTENFKRAATAIGVDIDSIVMARQIHKTDIKYVDENNRGMGITKERYPDGYDGIMTDKSGVTLVTLHADCVPLYFLDVKNKAIALSHAGWRGTVDKMAEVTLKAMAERFGTGPENILVGIGPCISSCCFEVGAEVRDEFIEKLDFAYKYIVPINGKAGKYLIDLKGVNRELIINYGVPEKNIETALECTKCMADKFFSHRIMGDNRGSMAAFLALK